MEVKKIIGIVTDFCEDHAVYAAIFPAPNGHGVVLVEGSIEKLTLESQTMIAVGASIVAEVTDDGNILNVFCPYVETLEPGFSSDDTERWLKQVQKQAGIEAKKE